ncbi:LysR family transcriptional regulator [Marinomonas rhizomae]|uniref:LysR family transcriptional regulator n=1 Tax=Marinomonas rhizomae TaxID=491948 RepID=A0A366JAA2_9GAMM|nr:LysR family transcriptional regulator [Marinomonas rhizomae]RBP83214.1 LysR family transcriptional regulator [Marinomonas rhizomae]RNF72489.1 LysR family transcriptional regulator [Marinomonas rhizomae]
MKTFQSQISDADLRILRIYKTVVECGGFSAAEVVLNISRAAISIAISDLETRLGFRLCQRGRSGFSLTNEGSQVYEHTLQLLSSIEDFRTHINALHQHLKGELNIGITDNLVTLPHTRITHSLAGLKDKGPQVTVNIRMIPPTDVERGVLDGGLHVGIVPDLKILSGLEYHHLYEEESKLYCSNTHPLFDMDDQKISKAKLKNYDAVLPAYAQTPEIKAQHQPLQASATATDREGVAFLILTGRYIGFLPDHVAAHWERDGRMRSILPNECRYITQFSAITRKGARTNLVLETFLKELEKTA